MSYKNVQHYRHTVHRYLDAIWGIGCHKGKARTSMYNTLANRMGLSIEETHVKYFTRAQCKQAIRILRPMYIQLYGKDLDYKRRDKMYYSEETFKVPVCYALKVDDEYSDVSDIWNITVYCKGRNVDSNGMLADFDNISNFLYGRLSEYNNLNNLVGFDPTEETMARWICEQIVPCYKIKIVTADGKLVIFEEENI